MLLHERSKGKTVVVITHRLNTARIADSIIVLANGTVAEEGNHEELLEKNGEYARQWHEQQNT
jgi:ABC-type multidrug transport system fused ATPase/permease subunit